MFTSGDVFTLMSIEPHTLQDKFGMLNLSPYPPSIGGSIKERMSDCEKNYRGGYRGSIKREIHTNNVTKRITSKLNTNETDTLSFIFRFKKSCRNLNLSPKLRSLRQKSRKR